MCTTQDKKKCNYPDNTRYANDENWKIGGLLSCN